jgi:hypothetical protein
MRRHLAFAVALWAIAAVGAATAQAGWVFLPSSYTHDPATGARVAQYAPKKAAYVRSDPTYQQSAYRHNRSSIRAGGSADRLHLVETWGAGETIRPYGEWQRPFREGATPYGPWGNPAGPWTTPFGAWVNPYGLGRLPLLPWYPWFQGPYQPLPSQGSGLLYGVPGGTSGAESAGEEG